MNITKIVLLIIAALIPSIAFVYGRIALFSKTALYIRLINGGVGCIALGKWYELAKYIAEKEYVSGFHLGILSTIGVFIFFLSSNFGQVNTLVDDGSDKYKKYRRIALLAPIFVIILCGSLYFTIENYTDRTIMVVIGIVVAFADYYHLKLLIFPDIDFGFAKCVRGFNLLALIYSVMCLSWFSIYTLNNDAVIYVFQFIMALISGSILFVTVRGVKKWTI